MSLIATCSDQVSALDALVGGMGQLLPDQQAPAFTARRPDIERVASHKYDYGQLKKGIAFVDSRDLREARVLK
jgi:hypothetical protein